MKTDMNQNDDSLHQAMQEWRVTTPLPLHFQDQVWQRIMAAENRAKAPASGKA